MECAIPVSLLPMDRLAGLEWIFSMIHTVKLQIPNMVLHYTSKVSHANFLAPIPVIHVCMHEANQILYPRTVIQMSINGGFAAYAMQVHV